MNEDIKKRAFLLLTKLTCSQAQREDFETTGKIPEEQLLGIRGIGAKGIELLRSAGYVTDAKPSDIELASLPAIARNALLRAEITTIEQACDAILSKQIFPGKPRGFGVKAIEALEKFTGRKLRPNAAPRCEQWWDEVKDSLAWSGAIQGTAWADLWPEAQADLRAIYSAARCRGPLPASPLERGAVTAAGSPSGGARAC
jgi:hypothetical protein